jgi:hypothetical protein
METPSGFAAFDDEDVVRAISPEGVLVRARTVENDPPQTLDFWAEALERQLTESGYLLVDRSSFESGAGPGVLLEWLAPVNADDWMYLTALAVSETSIAIVESAGPSDEYGKYRDAIRESLETLALGSAGGEE